MIKLLVPKVPAVFHYILYFQDMFSFALNPATLGNYSVTVNIHKLRTIHI